MKRMMRLYLFLLFLIVFPAGSYAQSAFSVQEADLRQSTAVSGIFQEDASLPDKQDTEESNPENETKEIGKDRLLYMGQASIRITTADGKVIYIDPYVGNGYEPAADLILVTHSHYDHNGVEKVVSRNPGCRVITWEEALENGEHQVFDLGFATVEAVEAGYNDWHSVKECVGYIITLADGISVYVTGDTLDLSNLHPRIHCTKLSNLTKPDTRERIRCKLYGHGSEALK